MEKEADIKVIKVLGFEFGGTGVKIGFGEKILKDNKI